MWATVYQGIRFCSSYINSLLKYFQYPEYEIIIYIIIDHEIIIKYYHISRKGYTSVIPIIHITLIFFKILCNLVNLIYFSHKIWFVYPEYIY